MANTYVKTPVRRFLQVHREQHVSEGKWRYESAAFTEMKQSGLTPIHPSEAAKPKFKPCLAAGIFPIKPTKDRTSKSFLPVPVVSGSSTRQAKSITSAKRKGKSRIPVLADQHTILAPRIEALKKKERELMLELLKTRADRERVEGLQEKLLVQKSTTPIKKSKRRSKSLVLDSPYTERDESFTIGTFSPLLLLSAAKSKNPVSIYNNYRKTINFLQTPSRSTFKQRTRPANLQTDNNISHHLQSQLSHLFA